MPSVDAHEHDKCPWKACSFGLPNAGPEPRPEAGARHERTLFAVACTPMLGCPSLALGQLDLEAVRPMELAELFRQEPTHHLRPHNEFSQPMAYGEEPFRLLRRHPLAC
jgi:hypothetical protein